jgi:hypothetical protein
LYSSFCFTIFEQCEIVNEELNVIFSIKKMGLIKNENQFEGHSNTQVDISTLSAGVYFIRIQSGDINELHKLIVR